MRRKKEPTKIGRPSKGELTPLEMAECEYLRKIREAHNMTQQDICDKVLILSGRYSENPAQANSYRQYESGKHRIPSWMKDCFSKYFDLPRGSFDDPSGTMEKVVNDQKLQAERLADYIYTPADQYVLNLIRLNYKLVRINENYDMILNHRGTIFTISREGFAELSESIEKLIDEVVINGKSKPAENKSAEGSEENKVAPARRKKSKLSDNSKKGV